MKIDVVDDPRFTKRKMYDSLGNDILKILTEIITNSDDSYKRMAPTDDVDKEKPISIILDKKKNVVEIVDNAQGMSADVMKEKFQTYGADKSDRDKGYKVRSLFGKGASDVLFTQNKSQIISIKEGVGCKGKFIWEKEHRQIDLQEIDRRVLKDLRDHYKIPNNGTIVKFELNEKTKIPKQFKEKLQVFYMLRHIFSNTIERKIELIEIDKKGTTLKTVLSYEFPPFNEIDVLYNEILSFDYEGKKINSSFKIIKLDDKKKFEDTYGELKILVYDDEKNIYDNTLFGLEKLPGAEFIYGELILDGTANIIREKLNTEMPEEILTDTRDGFNKRHDFYKKLSEIVEPILRNAISKIREGSKTGFQSDGYKKWNEAFHQLNKYMEMSIEEINDTGGDPGVSPPVDGMQFSRERIKITIGKKYCLKLLINPKIIIPGSRIIFENSNKDCLNLISDKITEVLSKNIDKNGIISINLSIEGIKITEKDCFIQATVEGSHIQKKLFVSVVDQEIYYPKYGLEFYPNYLRTIPAHSTNIHLYFDTKKFPLGSKVNFTNSNEKIQLSCNEYILKEDDLIFETIGKIDIGLRCEEKDQEGTINANCNGYETSILIEVAESGIEPIGKRGWLNGWATEDAPGQPWQKYLDPTTGKIKINTSNHINIYHFGESLTDEKIKKDKLCQRYLAELISEQAAIYLVKKKIEKGKVKGDDYEELLDEQQKEKNNIAKIIYKTVNDLVDKA